MIRIDAIWLATEPLVMRAGSDTALSRVVQVFGMLDEEKPIMFLASKETIAPQQCDQPRVIIPIPVESVCYGLGIASLCELANCVVCRTTFYRCHTA